MGIIKFDKKELINLEYSLSRELLRTNRAGTYANTTIVGCNTRKYHGLLVCPMEDIDNENHVMLSALDATIIQHDASFNLGVRKYPGIYEPKGHKYVRDFEVDVIPRIVYRVGGVVLQVERILSEDDRIMIKYTLLDAHSETKLRLKPFLAFRNIHKLSKANLFVNTKYQSVENGIKLRMYEGYKSLFMQFSKKVEYIHVPDWYYNVEYIEEQKRGYDFQEDLYVPGYFEMNIKKGDSIIFSAGLKEIKTSTIKTNFSSALKKRSSRETYIDCLKSSAQQFFYKRDGKTEIIAGFPWFGRWGRDTFIALPGLTLYNNGDIKTCRDVLNTMTADLKDGLFPNIGTGETTAMNSVDAPLWFFWSLQEYSKFITNKSEIWKDFGKKIIHILENYRNGTHYSIKMHDNGLIWAGETGKALTWMDAIVAGKPVTPRHGFAVEINALWYNALMFALELAKEAKDKKFVKEWSVIPEITKLSFIEKFWSEERQYLADYATYDYSDFSVRPNQIFACSLPYSPLSDVKKERILETVRKKLLTPKGLRSLSPDHCDYKGVCEGNQEERDSAYHQGTVWPWLLGHFCDAYLKIHEESALNFVEKIFNGFQEDMTVHGIGSISEIYDGDPPHSPRGAISQAWSVSEIIRIHHIIENYKNTEAKL
ncbi:MAG: amylo-alpha-1,6-glucosidase [Bacteroidales bacterium]|nr:amylo-alpha-1,6-glucosidase [Bacteroidales bacterium]